MFQSCSSSLYIHARLPIMKATAQQWLLVVFKVSLLSSKRKKKRIKKKQIRTFAESCNVPVIAIKSGSCWGWWINCPQLSPQSMSSKYFQNNLPTISLTEILQLFMNIFPCASKSASSALNRMPQPYRSLSCLKITEFYWKLLSQILILI